MSDNDKTAKQLADEVFKHEFKASEKMRLLFNSYDPQDAESGVVESFKELCKNIEDPDRLAKAVQLMQTMAQQLGSERMDDAAVQVAKQSEHLQVREQ